MSDCYVQVFESVADMLAKTNAAWRPWYEKDHSMRRAEFIGRAFANWADVVARADDAWDEGIAIVEGMLADLASAEMPRPLCRRRRAAWSADGGDEIDIDRLRSGQDCWRVSRREEVAGSAQVTIFVGVAARSGLDAKDILWRGAAALALANRLEEAGYRVELWAVNCIPRGSYEDGQGMFGAVRLKRADQPLDAASLVNAVSGWFFRTVWFASFLCRPDSRPTRGFGMPRAVNPEMDPVRDLADGGRVLCIDGAFDRAAALDVVRQALVSMSQPA